MSWFLLVIFLSLSSGSLLVASNDKKLPSAVVVGTVYCDTCFQQEFSTGSHFISGASVAVECKDGNNLKPRFWKEVKTDEHGKFKIVLPFSVNKHVMKIKACTVKLLSSSEPHCAVASAAASSSLHLKSIEQGQHIFSAGFFSFKPFKQPILCNQKPTIQKNTYKSKEIDASRNVIPQNFDPSFPPPLQDPTNPPGFQLNLPPMPGLPTLPQLPLLPPLPGLPWISSPSLKANKEPNPTKYSKEGQVLDQKVAQIDDIFPPNPLQPPNLPPFIPGPLQPPSVGPPPLFPFPPTSGSRPSPPPPSLPAFPFPFPPFFRPPIGPGLPPAPSSKNTLP